MTLQSVSQGGAEVLFRVVPALQTSQAGAEYAHRVLPGMLVAQAGAEFLHRVTPSFAISQAGAEYLHKFLPCTTHWTQIWTITRTDGETLRFTALDRDFLYRGHTYLSCNSMRPSASENVGTVDDSGTMDLTGLIAAGAISQTDLHAGLYDGAEVEANLVAWAGPDIIRPLLKGTFGRVSYSDHQFNVEVMGDGARLQQTPLVKTLQPNCRYQFGDSLCAKSLAPLEVSGTVTASNGQRGFTDSARLETPGYFRFGRVTFTDGPNAGISAEIKDHEAGGTITLWPRMAFGISIGDSYTMTPGCTNTPEGSGGCNGCKDWGNYINYGGEPSVPGKDKVASRPDVKS